MKKTIDIYITKVCNLNCEYCYVELEDTVQNFDSKTFQKKIHLLEYKTIRFIGGEPLIKWIDIVKIVEMVTEKNPNIVFHIITNGLLFTANKIAFIKQHKIIIENSLHFQSISKILSKKYLEMVFPIRELIRFSIIFEPHRIKSPVTLIIFLVKYGFYHFIVSPEVYANWNVNNIALLQKEINSLLNLVNSNAGITFHGPDTDQLVIKKNDCHKIVSDELGNIHQCNRINKIPIGFEYDSAFDFFNTINQCYSCEKKWFCICPVSWYLDHLNSPEILPIKAKMFHVLNEIFIEFASEIQKIRGNRNFLTGPYDEIRFNMTNQCNLRCNYCYLDFNNSELSYEIASNIIEWHIRAQGTEKVISFFGGEPLLGFKAIVELVSFAKKLGRTLSKNIRFTIATNAILITKDIASFLKDNHFEIHISWNGDIQIHNETRDGSYVALQKGLEILQSFFDKKDIVILFAFGPKQLPLLYASFSHIFGLGYTTFNFELFYGNEYIWDYRALRILDIQIRLICNTFGKDMNCLNIRETRNSIDISTEGSIASNSFGFHGKKTIDFSPKEQLLSSLRTGMKSLGIK